MTTTMPTGANLLDTSKVLRRPGEFRGEEKEWRDWRFAFETCFAYLDTQADESLVHAVSFQTRLDPAQCSAEVQELGRLLYLAMAQT